MRCPDCWRYATLQAEKRGGSVEKWYGLQLHDAHDSQGNRYTYTVRYRVEAAPGISVGRGFQIPEEFLADKPGAP